MADWSADGKNVVYTSGAARRAPGSISTAARSRRCRYDYAGGTHTFGEPQYLVHDPITLPHGTFTNFFFPSYSPDGELVVFNAARTALAQLHDARAPGQRLMLADAERRMIIAISPRSTAATSTATSRGRTGRRPTANDYYWVVFSSERDYGHRVTLANSHPSCIANGVLQCKQIWLGAIAQEQADGAGIDPSAPPMWLPGQDIAANNISPFWTKPSVLQ